MSELPRPLTHEAFIHLEHQLPKAVENIIEFEEKGQPIILWHDHLRSDLADHRHVSLTAFEREQVMLQVLAMCGIPEDFHVSVKLLKSAHELDDKIWVSEKTFGEQRPTLTQVFNWLGDIGSIHRDDPNDFTVGITLDSPKGLVVIKHQSEEIDFEYNDYEYDYEIAMYPKDQIDKIWWYINRYSPRA
jgi:hypothetical protein